MRGGGEDAILGYGGDQAYRERCEFHFGRFLSPPTFDLSAHARLPPPAKKLLIPAIRTVGNRNPPPLPSQSLFPPVSGGPFVTAGDL
jgi:hypothetical protein